MSDNLLNALVFIQNWGNEKVIIDFLKMNTHVISIFHIMGRYSYIVDTNFDNKNQLKEWVRHFKSITLSSASGIPAIISLQTQKIIEVNKQKSDFNLKNYKNLSEPFHFFMMIDNPHHDEELVDLLKKDEIVHSILHIQGRYSFIVEVITENYDNYKNLLNKTKTLETINHIETQEVIIVTKYRNQVTDDVGNLIYPEKDIRELYTL